MAARLGGDEFTVILPELSCEQDAGLVARRIAEHIAQPMDLGNHRVIVTPSIGIAIFPHDGEDMETLLKNADIAMYYSKRIGPNMFSYYRESMNATALKKMTVENLLRQAFERNEFTLHYQPQFDLSTSRLTGVEALLRWTSHELGEVPPIEFIPIAEESGIIVAIGEWVLRRACGQAKKWLDQNYALERIAVNVSVKQITHPDFLKTVRSVLAETGLEPHRLEIEITESLIVSDKQEIAIVLNSLNEIGIRIAVDDFGTGYSNLSRLREMPIDCLKIDRTFVSGITGGTKNQSIICAIIAMAEGMNLRVVAEGVETKGQVDFLRGKQCREVQGFLFSRPLTVQQIEHFLQERSA
jgi:predicted signal transduction protein with EAL and GGDEF domain